MSADKSTAQTHLTTVAVEQTWTVDSFSSYVFAEEEFPWLYWAPFSLDHGHINFSLALGPNGECEESKGYVALYLQCTADHFAELPVNYQFSIIDKDGQHKITGGRRRES